MADDPDNLNYFPDFIIVGAAKSGTTSLQTWLCAHPDIVMPERELNFYSQVNQPSITWGAGGSITRDRSRYLRRLQSASSRGTGSREQHMLGEKSVTYLYSPWCDETLRQMQRLHPRVDRLRLLALLRDPVDRMYSQYVANRARRLEPLEFADAVGRWPDRQRRGWPAMFDYIGPSRYATALASYEKAFGDRLLVCCFEQLIQDPPSVLAAMYRHLGVDPKRMQTIPEVHVNPSGVPKSTLAAMLYGLVAASPMARIGKWILPNPAYRKLRSMFWRPTHVKPPLLEQHRRQFASLFQHDIAQLTPLVSFDPSVYWATAQHL